MKRFISIAPMMAYTDRHFRMLARMLSPNVGLYTEMVTANEVIRNPQSQKLKHHAAAKPVALQLGGSDPKLLAQAAHIGENLGYDEINLNVGCPSARVQSGRIGACLMKEPSLVAECVVAMKEVVKLPVTVKTRIGVDSQDDYASFYHFVKTVSQLGGCQTFIIHARKAWLKGLNPKENRTLPPLCYERVYRLKQDFPKLEIIINGGIKTVAETEQHLKLVDGVMIGREAYSDLLLLPQLDILQQKIENKAIQDLKLNRAKILEQYINYMENELTHGERLHFMLRHLHGMFRGMSSAKKIRTSLAQAKNLNQLKELFEESL